MVVNLHKLLAHIQLALLALGLLFSSLLNAMPDELYQGMIQFELESGNHFNALTLMDQNYQSTNPVDHAVALKGFNINADVNEHLEEIRKKGKQKTSEISYSDYFKIGRLEYQLGNCKPALRAFKKLKNKLAIEDKQEWVFYRANCFIRLGSNSKAMQVLNDTVEGEWASHAYYNLAISYDAASRNKSNALKSLKLALLLNKGKSLEEIELKNQINFTVGLLYLNAEKPDLASNFFKKVYLNSAIAPEALYLNGLAKLELNDFRAATQSWFSVKKYPLVNQSVAEALLAIPYAYERSGYIGQALEAYLEASGAFNSELKIIAKIDALLEQYGAQKILIEDNNIEGLEWFLAKDVVTNTMKATYYSYFMQNEEIYDAVELFTELKMLVNSMEFWSSQLNVFDRSIKEKRTNFTNKSKKFNSAKTQSKIDKLDQRLNDIKGEKALTPQHIARLQVDNMQVGAKLLMQRLKELKIKVSQGQGRLKSQLKHSNKLNKQAKNSQKQLLSLIKKLDLQITAMIRSQLAKLKTQMLANYERSEQGLMHVFQDISESNRVQKNRLDGRYK